MGVSSTVRLRVGAPRTISSRTSQPAIGGQGRRGSEIHDKYRDRFRAGDAGATAERAQGVRRPACTQGLEHRRTDEHGRPILIALLLIAVGLGGFLHRITGMGFALVASPMLVLILGASNGVMMVNVGSSVSAGMVLARLWRDIEWRRVPILITAAGVGIVPGAWVAVNLAGPWLQISVGVLLIASIAGSLIITQTAARVRGKIPATIAAFLSGSMNAATGLGGPPLSAYAVLSRWDQASFAATIQPYFLFIGLSSIASKLWMDPASAPVVPLWAWASIVLVLAGGHALGDRVAAVISVRHARVGVLMVSFAGSLVAIGNGMAQLH